MRPRTIGALLLTLAGCGEASVHEERTALARSTAATRGLDPARMAKVVEQARALPRIQSLLVLRHGETLAEHRFNGGPPLDRAVNIKSASKTILATLAGIAIDKGVLSGVDQPILRADAPTNPDPRLARITVGDLLSMRAGLERTSGENYGR